MKRMLLIGNILMLASSLLMASCDKAETPKEREDIMLTKAQQQIKYTANAFTFDFLAAACNKETAGKNIFMSPFSIQMALAMAAEGAAGNTQAEMYNAIGFSDFEADEVSGFYRSLIPALQKVDNTTTFEIANSFWAKECITIKDSYTSGIRSNFYADVFTLPDNSRQAANEINGWCKKSTHGMIEKIVDEVDGDVLVSLLNAIYFKGTWTKPFDKANNTQDKFTNWDGTSVTTTFMNRTFDNTRVYSDEYVEAVSLPYGNQAFTMTIIVPRNGMTIEKVLAGLDNDRWEDYRFAGYTYETIFSMPKFEEEYAADDICVDILKEKKMLLAFSPAADFTAMSDTRMCIDEIRHKARIRVDEEGTEAAAVTYIGMKLTAMPSGEPFYFTVDRPFLYFISETSTGAILFAGAKKSL